MGNAGAISRASKMRKHASTSTCSSQFLSLRKAEDGLFNATLALAFGNHRNVTVYHDGAAHFDVDANKEHIS